MLGGADNPNGELPSYITGADNLSLSLRLSSLHGLFQISFTSSFSAQHCLVSFICAHSHISFSCLDSVIHLSLYCLLDTSVFRHGHL